MTNELETLRDEVIAAAEQALQGLRQFHNSKTTCPGCRARMRLEAALNALNERLASETKDATP